MSQEAKLLFFHVNGASPQKYIVETVGSGAGFLDYDNDGWMDVYFVNGGPTPTTVPAVSAANQLFRNNRDGTFTEVTEKAGVGDTSYGVGCAFADYDNDGFVDICVTNVGPNVMYHNNGDGTFEDISLVSGTAFGESGAPRAGMGVDAADLNGNGLFNIFVTNYSLQHNALYWNEGSGVFIDRAVDSRLAGPSYLPLGFGANFFDYDNDGFVDLFVGNGHVLENTKEVSPSTEYRQLNQLFRHLGQGRFVEVSSQAGAYFSRKNVRLGSATGDFNNDGKMDLLVTNNNDGADLLENRTAGANHWLKLNLEGTHCNRDAVGAKVTLTAGDYRLTQEVRAGNSYLSQSDLRLHFGVGNRTCINSLQVSWSCGKKQRLAPIKELGQIIHIQEK